jgi:hypothetical protein
VRNAIAWAICAKPIDWRHRAAKRNCAAPARDRRGQQQRPQQILLRSEIGGLQPQTQGQHRVAAHAGGELRLRDSASHQLLQCLGHHTGRTETCC